MTVARRGRPTGGPLPPPVTTGMARRDTRQDQGQSAAEPPPWFLPTMSPGPATAQTAIRPVRRPPRCSSGSAVDGTRLRTSGQRSPALPTSRWDSPRACGGPRRTRHRTAVRSGFADGTRLSTPAPRAPARAHHLRIRGDARHGLPLLPSQAPVSLMAPGNSGLTGHLRGRPGTSQRGSSPSSAVALPSTAESELRATVGQADAPLASLSIADLRLPAGAEGPAPRRHTLP